MFGMVRERLGLGGKGRTDDHSEPSILVFDSATVAPLRIFPNQKRSPASVRAETGVYTTTGEHVLQSQLYRNGKYIGQSGNFSATSEKQDKVVYCGRWIDQFGHFLLESLSRIWCADDFPEHALCWSVAEGSSRRPKQWQIDLIQTLCGKRKIILVDQATKFSSVVVPSPGFIIPNRFDSHLNAFFERRARNHEPRPGVNVWLSRSRAETEKGLLNSAVLDRHLEKAGWQVLYPESLSIEEQLEALASAERVAGEEGSALHLLMLLRNASRLRVDIFPRLSKSASFKKHYELIAERKGFVQTIHDLPAEKLISRRRNKVVRIAENFAGHLSALNIPITHTDKTVSIESDRQIGDVQAGSTDQRSCLQIGIGKRNAYETIPSANTTLITSSGQIDPRSLVERGCRIFEMDLPNYLAHFHNPEDRFDIIVLGDEFQDLDYDQIREQLGTSDAIVSALSP